MHTFASLVNPEVGVAGRQATPISYGIFVYQYIKNYWKLEFHVFDLKIGFYAKNPTQNRLEMSRILNFGPK